MTTTTDQHRHYFIDRGALTAAGLALGVVLTGCTTSPGPNAAGGTTTTSTTSATSAPTTGVERDIVVAGRHFRARCDGDGPAIIAVLDYGRSMDDTLPAVQNLALHAQVCLYDRLGVGRSDSAPRLQTFASQADDLDGVISGLGLTRPVVVLGDSLGAPIALTWASRHENDARAVVLLTPPLPVSWAPTAR